MKELLHCFTSSKLMNLQKFLTLMANHGSPEGGYLDLSPTSVQNDFASYGVIHYNYMSLEITLIMDSG